MSFLAASRMSLLLFCALSAGLQSGFQVVASTSTRNLQQSNGPANVYGNAASATTADLVNDPAGRAHLLVSTASPRQHRCGTVAALQPDSQTELCCRHNNNAAQARLGNPVAYTGSYPLYVGAGQYNVDPSVDPAVQTPINGGE